jgi:hypothetical protein
LRTPWEQDGNKKITKKSLPTPPPPIEKIWTCMLSLLIGCMKLVFSKLFVTILGLG